MSEKPAHPASRLITVSCEAALGDLVRAVELWQRRLPLPPNVGPAMKLARVALEEAQAARAARETEMTTMAEAGQGGR